MRIRLLYILILGLSPLSFIKAQDLNSAPNKYFFLGLGIPIIKVKDEAHSPLTYKGWSPTLRIGYEDINKDYVSRIVLSTAFGAASPQSKPKPKIHLSNLDLSQIQFNYAYYRRNGAYNTEGWNYYLGGAITLTFDIRNYNLPSNNLVGYQNNASINFGTFIQKKLDTDWRFNYEAWTPLLSYSLRPSYLGMVPMKTGDFNAKSIFSNGKIVTVNKLFRFYNRFSLDQQINDHRQRRLYYSWDYHNNTISKTLQSVNAGLGYESLFKM